MARARRWLRYFPWLSLATGIGGAFMMNRTPERAWLVVLACLAGWLLLFALNFVERSLIENVMIKSRSARLALVFGSQAAVQTAVFFPLPFYVKAASVTPGHALFFVVYGSVVIVALWDPLYERAMARGWSAFAVHAFSAFIGLNMVLPVLGMSNRASLLLAGALTAVGVPVLFLASSSTSPTPAATSTAGLPTPARWSRRWRWLALPAGLLVVIAARFGAPLVPPAPLELTSIAIGSRVDHKQLIDAAALHDPFSDLVCHSAIKAPLGLHDQLVHVWRFDDGRGDQPLDEIALEVSGGRAAGFRTWSKKRAPPEGWSPGRYSCRVETASGQVVGVASVRIAAEHR